MPWYSKWYSGPQAASSFHESLEVPLGYASVSAAILTVHSLLWQHCRVTVVHRHVCDFQSDPLASAYGRQ